MRIVSQLVARPLEDCWRGFTEYASMPQWVPGLREATLVEFDVTGLPYEVRFGYVAGLTYSLYYTYDLDEHCACVDAGTAVVGCVAAADVVVRGCAGGGVVDEDQHAARAMQSRARIARTLHQINPGRS